jgi:hypothetical protein
MFSIFLISSFLMFLLQYFLSFFFKQFWCRKLLEKVICLLNYFYFYLTWEYIFPYDVSFFQFILEILFSLIEFRPRMSIKKVV